MHALRSTRALIGALSLALAALTMAPATAAAGPEPGAKRPATGKYRLFAGNLGAITVNRLYYGLNTRGEVGVDSTNSSTIGGGYWPKGTGNQYMFNSGLQVAGVVQGNPATNPWAGDTTGGMFFDARGTNQHGDAVTEIFNATNPVDVANWPQAAYVPEGDFSEEIFDELLRGRLSASQGDVWFLSWEADPNLSGGRPHPLGILAEYRLLGWNYPTGNEDIIYLVITYYNISTTNPAAYAGYRAGMPELLLDAAEEFHSLSNARFGITLPADGYTIDPFYVAFAADPDVTSDAGDNFSSVNLPFAMGYAYHPEFPRAAGWTFSPQIFGAPFFAGSGFVGMKYLKSASGPGEIELFSNTCNGCGDFNDPANTTTLFKYLSGTVTPEDGVSCNQGNPAVTNICWIENGDPTDVRLLQSSTPAVLEPGGAGSIVIAYVHAAPVAVPSVPIGGGAIVGVGDPLRLTNAADLATLGANDVDKIAGFISYEDGNDDGIVQQDEMTVVNGSLLGKALTAQEIFNNKFLLPFAPDAPEFFLIPGDHQVTLLWRPSASEEEGDPFFEVASQATNVPDGGGAPVPNLLYDPNYRRFDVEGYRIYRGRADTPTSLNLIAQYDYSGTTFRDYRGQVVDGSIGSQCAPELDLTTSCAGFFSPVVPGEPATLFRSYNIGENFVQVNRGDRTLLASGDVINLVTDTAVTGRNAGFPALTNSGVPFVFVDNNVRNGLTYFYAVTAFDVNSVSSTGVGNTSLESARITQRVVPRRSAGNYANSAEVQSSINGRNGPRTDSEFPTIDPATGIFSKRFPVTQEGFDLSLVAVVKELLSGAGDIRMRLDSVTIVSSTADLGGSAEALQHFTIISNTGEESSISVPKSISPTNVTNQAEGSFDGALSADDDLSAAYGGGAGYGIGGSYRLRWPGAYYNTIQSRGCINGAAGFGSGRPCSYNGPRWFQGEPTANPNSGNVGNFNTGQIPTDFNNAGALPGVASIFMPNSYEMAPTTWRRIEGPFSAFAGAADYNVYWGTGGTVDSVIDLTYDVAVPFSPTYGTTWGILNGSDVSAGQSYDQRAELTYTDASCVQPLKGIPIVQGALPCSGSAVTLSQTAEPGPVVFSGGGSYAGNRTAAAAAGNGFIFYLKGRLFLMELEGAVPAEGTVWTMRDYVGAISGGNGVAGNFGDYSFSRPRLPVQGTNDTIPVPLPFTAAGAAAVFSYDVTNEVQASTQESLAAVHTVPDPYYVTSAYEATTTNKVIRFVNLPETATIRIYSTSGVLVRVLKQETNSFEGEVVWDVRNRNNQFVASGVYFYHVTAENGESTVGRMTIVNYAN